MKRAVTAAVFGGLIMFFVPQAASGGTAQPVAPYDHNAGQRDGDCPGKTREAHDPERSAPGGRSQYDHEQRESDGGETLF